ncbi:MAG TPA: hypothetical protein VGM94_00910 [Galbitalea sp.]|jgi:hypothetical protein
MGAKKLKASAVLVRDGKESTATVTLVTGSAPVIRIDGTMGSWYLADVRDSNGVWVDFGQGLACTNIAALVAEAYAMLRGDGDGECA